MEDAQITELRKGFPVTQHYVYLNHAACSPMPQVGVDAYNTYWAEQSTQGTVSERKYFPIIEAAREKMARLIGADPSEIGWVPNTATAINLVAHGVRWRRSDNVIIVEGDFPANVYPWRWLRRQGVGVHSIQQRDGRVPIESIADRIDARTRLLSISFVQYSTGYRNDLYALGQLCHGRGILFNVDGIQGVGALGLDVHAAGIHFMGVGAQKWLMGPQGVGVFYIQKNALEHLHRSITASWLSVENPLDFVVGEKLRPLAAKASRVEGSTWNLSGLVALDRVLDEVHLKYGTE